MQIFLDCDGVLADFDKLFIDTHGEHPRQYEAKNSASAMWRMIAKHEGGFFRNLPKMPDADELVDAVRHLNPIILTGVPQGNPQYNEQKYAWRDEHYPDLPMICCQSKLKWTAMHDNKHNIIIDDWFKYKTLWEEKGGTFILHTSAQQSLSELRELGVI